MNIIEWFNAHAGRHLVSQTGNPKADAQRALSAQHAMINAQGKLSSSRLCAGWAIVSESRGLVIQHKLTAPGISVSSKTTREAFDEAIKEYDEPIMLLQFSKVPVPVTHLARTVDPRKPVVVTSKGVVEWKVT